MKNQQIERNNKATSRTAQRLRDLCVTRQCRDALYSFAIEKFIGDPFTIAEKAILKYIKFIEDYPHLAEAQPRAKNCNALLIRRPAQELSDQLDYMSFIYNLDPNQVADSAISVYLEFASVHPRFVQGDPGAIDPAQIACVLSRPSEPARVSFESAVAGIKSQPFDHVCDKLKGLLELTMHHPGFEQERVALEMIVEGAERIRE